MKKFAFLIFSFVVFASTHFAQKPATTPAKKPVAPITKKEPATNN